MTDELINVDDIDLTDVDTSRLMLEPGVYIFSVASITKKENSKKTGDNLSIELHLDQMAKSTKGKDVNPGFPIFDTISLVRTEKYDPRERLASFQEAVLGKKEQFMPVDKYLGKKVTVKVKIDANEQFGDQNRVGRYVKKA